MNRIPYRRQLEEILTENRLEHSLGVEYTAAALAMRYGADMEQAALAGLLHDCAKGLSDQEQISLALENGLSVSPAEYKNPQLLHAGVGAVLAEKKYGIRDEELLSAIRWHTTGRPGMTLLEKIIYIADYIEPSRSRAPHLEQVRKLAFQDLDQCLLMILKDTIHYLEETASVIDPLTRETYQYYTR